MKRYLFYILMLMTGIAFARISSLAQGTPQPPRLISIVLEGAGSSTHFKLDWSLYARDTTNITKFKIYKANIFTTDPAQCSYYATVTRYGLDTFWTSNVNPIFVGNYTFYITAVRTFLTIDYESSASNLFQARFKQGHVDVWFTTTPPAVGAAGWLYEYYANATSADSARVNYVLKAGPQAMTVDQFTGHLMWTPTVKGRYNVRLNAYLNFNPIGSAKKKSNETLIDTSDSAIDQNWLLLVKSCNNPTYFTGSVIDETGDTIREGTISIHSSNSFDIDSVYTGPISTNGTYHIEVLEGDYKLQAKGQTFDSVWFNNKTTIKAADPVYAPCGSTATVNWVVRRRLITDTIAFAFEPQTNAITDNEYLYNGAAQASSGRELRYKLDSAPPSMEVDPVSGLVRWTPSVTGRYYVSLKAYVLIDSQNVYAYKNFYIQVRSCRSETYAKGTVKDTGGYAIKRGNMQIHSDSGIDSLGIFYGTVNEDGTYLIKIEEGNSKVYIEGEGFYSQWYDNKMLQDSADIIPCPCGDTTNINFLVYKTPPLNLSITSSPSKSILLGNIYNYQPVVTGNAEREVRYILFENPSGMTIDNITGEIHWEPANVGGYSVKLKAYLFTDSANSFVTQEWWVKVRSCDNNTYLSGNVLDELENPIPTGSVRIVNASGMDSLGYYTGTIENGSYTVLVDEGSCKVYAEGPTFRGEWYRDKTSEQTATPIDVSCGSNSNANLMVHLYTNYIISGKVTDEVTGNPIENAMVYFQSTDFLDSTSTNQAGNYSISLNEKYGYTAWANVPGNPLYITQYYKLTGNITEATPVEFTGDISNIDFVLKLAPTAGNRMFGIVETPQGEPIRSIVLNFLIFPKDTTIASMFDCRTFITGISGNYEFMNLAEGSYILLAIPYSDKYVPGYFKQDSIAVPSWLDATMVNIVDGEMSGPHIITMPQILPITGYGKVEGMITGETLPVFLKPDDNLLAIEDIDGAVVISVDKDEKVRKYNLSNSIGYYKIDSLAQGDYTISIDKVGYGKYSFEVSINDSNKSQNTDAELILNIPIGVNEDFNHTSSQVRVYPNPANGYFNLRLDDKWINSEIILFDAYGQTMTYEKSTYDNFPYIVKIHLNNASQGLFFVRIAKNYNVIVVPVIVIK